MLQAVLLGQSKGNEQAGPGGLKGLRVTLQPLSPAACCLLQPSPAPPGVLIVWQFFQNLLAHGKATDQTSKP